LSREHAFTAADGPPGHSGVTVFNESSGGFAMSTAALKLIPAVLLVLGFHTTGAFAQQALSARSAPSVAERLHANALASFREARFPEAYGRFIALADAGHAPAAGVALWMYLQGPTLFGKEWDSSQEQLTAWAKLAGQPVPTMVARIDPRNVTSVASLTR
jgi:hypothetical protein